MLLMETVNWPHGVLEAHGHLGAWNDIALPVDVQMYSTERQRAIKRERKVTLNSQLASAWSGGGVRATVGTIIAWTDNISHNQF